MLISTRRIVLQFLDRLPFYKINFNEWTSCRRTAPLSSLFFCFFETIGLNSVGIGGRFFPPMPKWQTVSVMFTLSGPQTLPHGRICSCFPDTFPPFEFRSFYPNVMSVRLFFFLLLIGAKTGTTKSDSVNAQPPVWLSMWINY
jgi:hypothetical protein